METNGGDRIARERSETRRIPRARRRSRAVRGRGDLKVQQIGSSGSVADLPPILSVRGSLTLA